MKCQECRKFMSYWDTLYWCNDKRVIFPTHKSCWKKMKAAKIIKKNSKEIKHGE